MKNSWNTFYLFLALWMYVVPNTGAPVVRLKYLFLYMENNPRIVCMYVCECKRFRSKINCLQNDIEFLMNFSNKQLIYT